MMVKVVGSKLGVSLSQQKKKIKCTEQGENFGLTGKIFGTEQVKRSASELSPQKNAPSKKRSAFGDITNAVQVSQIGKAKKTKERSSKVVNKSAAVLRSKGHCEEAITRDNIPDLDLLSSSDELLSSQESSECALSYSPGQKTNDKEIKDLSSKESHEEKEDASHFLAEGESKPFSNTNAKIIPKDVTDIDEDMADPFMAAEYAYEIFQNMKAREELFPLKSYMDSQKELSISMRAILVDWLVEVQESFELYHETLYVGVKILDHFLMECPVKREDLQLVGAVALFIASKVEERHAPCLDDFLYICDDAYQHAAFVAMERNMLKALDFELNIPIPYRFLRRYARAAFADVQTLTLARFLLESTLHNYQFLEYKPSLLASSCLYLALQMQKCGTWTSTLVYYTGYKSAELKECVLKLNAMNSEPPKKNLMTVRNKYSHKVFHEVALIPPVDVLSLDFM